MYRMITHLNNNGESSFARLFTWFFDLCVLQLIFRHLTDNCGEIKLPDYELEAIVNAVMPDMVAFFATEEGRKEYEAWLAEYEARRPEEQPTKRKKPKKSA